MRVLLARRFRGKTNTAELIGEEGGDPQELSDEQQQELESESASQSVQGQLLSQTYEGQIETNQAKGHPISQEPHQNLPPVAKTICKGTLTQQAASGISSQQKEKNQLKQSSQRKRRLGEKSHEENEENDCKQRRCQTSILSTTNEASSFPDRKPRAFDTGIIGNTKKRASIGDFNNHKVAPATRRTLPPKKAAPSSSISATAALALNQSNSSTSSSKHKMVSSGAGRRNPPHHGDSRQMEEERLLHWQYGVNNHQAHDTHDGPEITVRHTPEMDFEGPLENDPASARGDVPSASPERQHHDQVHDLQGSSPTANRNFSIGRRNELPPQARGLVENAHDVPRKEFLSESGRWKTSSQLSRQTISSNGNTKKHCMTNDEIQFRATLKKERGLEIREQEGDGNCLFRAISLQVYGDPSMHGEVRKQCMDHMERDQEHFSQFVTGQPFLQYIARTRRDGVHGNNPEIQSCSELFNRPIEVFTPENGSSPINIFHAEYKTGDVPIRLSYHDGNHYNAVIDPLVPTAGLGLGLPGLKPGHADRMQMDKAVAESINAAAGKDELELQQVLKASKLEFNVNADNDDDLQRAIKESQLSAEHMNSHNALSLSDMDATYFELEQAALEQSLQSLSQKDEGKKRRASTSASKPKERDGTKAQTIKGDYKAPAIAAAAASSTSACLPCPSQESIPLAAAAASSTVASAALKQSEPPPQLLSVEEYPSSVQELVMNGFALSSVVKAFDLVGDNFDHMLSVCLANANRAP